MKRHSSVKKHVVLLVTVALVGCREAKPVTNTIAPAEPRPAASATATMDLGPEVTTSGSPPPAVATSGSERVAIRDGVIAVRPLLPRGSTVFHFTNESSEEHVLALRGHAAMVQIPAGGTGILQVVLNQPEYELACTVPGHRERSKFRTYRPGHPIPAGQPRR